MPNSFAYEETGSVSLTKIDYLASTYFTGFGLWILAWGEGGAISAKAFEHVRDNIHATGLGAPYAVVGLACVFLGLFYAIAVRINGHGMYWTPIARGGACVTISIFMLHFSASIAATQGSSSGVFTYFAAGVVYFSIFIAHLPRISRALILIWERLSGVGA